MRIVLNLLRIIFSNIFLLFVIMLGSYTLTTLPVSAAPFAYVANSNDNTVSVIDTATNTVVPPLISVGSSPRGVAITPDGKHVYVTNVGDATVSVIDTTTNTVGDPIPVGNQPIGVAVTPLLNPTSEDQCKNGGWKAFGFKNQGQCIRFVNTGNSGHN